MKKVHKTVFCLSLITVLMFGFGFALVPLYNVFCQVTGINGKTSNVPNELAKEFDHSRVIVVHFTSTRNNNLPWKFYPVEKKILLHPGENRRITYFAENDSNKTMTVQAVPSVSPGEVAKYLKKTECFCFHRQTLNKGESKEMPVIFHLDRHIPKDIHELTLSYTLFDTAGLRENPKAVKGKIQ